MYFVKVLILLVYFVSYWHRLRISHIYCYVLTLYFSLLIKLVCFILSKFHVILFIRLLYIFKKMSQWKNTRGTTLKVCVPLLK